MPPYATLIGVTQQYTCGSGASAFVLRGVCFIKDNCHIFIKEKKVGKGVELHFPGACWFLSALNSIRGNFAASLPFVDRYQSQQQARSAVLIVVRCILGHEYSAH